ncbi:hypothetical protein G7054_g7976 [Neopestalotiopsis clavispora]|nr:hypothetical protein G7054_g7976 [Neopestalotiopsis clavispora]
MSAVDTISCTETVRCRYAEHLRSGAEQHELVPYMKLLRAYIPKITLLFNSDGVELCTSQNYQPRMTAAIPSRVAMRLAEIALENKHDPYTACEKYLEETWNNHGKLCDIVLSEEHEIANEMRMATTFPIAELFVRDNRKMPNMFKNWAPMNTMINITKTGTAVIFKDDKYNHLIRVWVEHEQ